MSKSSIFLLNALAIYTASSMERGLFHISFDDSEKSYKNIKHKRGKNHRR